MVNGDEQTRPDVAKKRIWWRKYLTRIDIARMVFIDETWTKTNMAPLRGWGSKGKRLIGRAPHGRWRTLTFLAALRAEGVTAPWLLNGPINGESFLIYVRDVLLPTLRPGDIVVLDNLGSHKAKAIRLLIKTPARGSSSCHPTVRTRTPSSSSSPSSNTVCARQKNAPKMPSTTASAIS